MSRGQRKRSEADIYHVTMRGEGRQLLFEDDEDRIVFMRMLSSSLDKNCAHALAWCLMSNHVHLLLKVDFDKLSRLMQGLMSGYAVYFNKRHDHVGHVFAGRYGSSPIDTDEYLMTAVRYIHFNPVKDRVSKSCEYRWSSYGDYLAGSGLTETALVLEVFDGIARFVEFHDLSHLDFAFSAHREQWPRTRLSDNEALQIAREALGAQSLAELASLEKSQRNEGVARLRQLGLSARQVERVTGIGRGIVERVEWRY